MSASKFTINQADDKVLQSALGDLTDEAYTSAKKFTGTGIVSGNGTINTGTETYTGQLRWEQPLKATINVGDIASADHGVLTHGAQEMLTYVKTTRAAGSSRKNLERALTQKDGLAKFARDQAEIRSQDEHGSILSVLRGVAVSEIVYGLNNNGGQTFDNDPESTTDKRGFYVDLNSKLVGNASSSSQGAQRAQSLIDALGMGFKDYEPPYAYLVANPELLADIRSANLVDSDPVQDGNLELETIFQGKFRLIKSRANMQLNATEQGKIDGYSGLSGSKLSFLILPGAIAFENLQMDEPVGTESSASANKGFGMHQLWFRWGYVAHPAGYSWAGPDNAFVPQNGYDWVKESSTWKTLSTVSGTADTGIWARKASSVLNLGILPIIHG